jgi:hypothetical protein
MSHADTARSELDTAASDGPNTALSEAETVGGLHNKIRRLETIIVGLETLIGQLKKNNDELRAPQVR